jgi:ornithine carbamoyltransferase
MLADFLTMHEASNKPYNAISYAFIGDLRFNMARSHVVMAALMGSDLRLAGPAHLFPPAEVLAVAESIANKTGASITVTDDVGSAVEGVDFIHTDVWVSMGESKDVWTRRIADLKAYQISADLLRASGNPGVQFMHCLPGFHDANTVVGAEVMAHTNMPDGIEVTHEVFESEASIVFEQAENRLHTIKAVVVATLA